MAPPKFMETIVGYVIPPACREEVLGDLHERYATPQHYLLEALRTLSMIVVSRVRRTADGELLLMEAFALYLCFLAAAWYAGSSTLSAPAGLFRLAIPVAVALPALAVADAYADPAKRSAWQPLKIATAGIACAFLSQMVLLAGGSPLALPLWIMTFGSSMSLLLVCSLRMLFPPVTRHLLGAHAPAPALSQRSPSAGTLLWIAAGGVALILCAFSQYAQLLIPLSIVMAACLAVIYQRRRRG